MKFDIVIGNPPYNSGLDLDFAFLGLEIADKVCLITPGKFQTAEPDLRVRSAHTYSEFQKKFVKHIKEIHFYPDCLDIFKIDIRSGIVYYLADRNTYTKIPVYNTCNLQTKLNSVSYRTIVNGESLINIGQEIIDYLKPYTSFKPKICTVNHKYNISVGDCFNRALGQSGAYDWEHGGINPDSIGKGGVMFCQDGTTTIMSAIKNFDHISSMPMSSKCMFSSDNKIEAESFVSYMQSKFVSFFLFIVSDRMKTVNNIHSYRFVPAPDIKLDGSYDWSHLYTDEYLYKKYKLPDKYIDIIESVIKQRKNRVF